MSRKVDEQKEFLKRAYALLDKLGIRLVDKIPTKLILSEADQELLSISPDGYQVHPELVKAIIESYGNFCIEKMSPADIAITPYFAEAHKNFSANKPPQNIETISKISDILQGNYDDELLPTDIAKALKFARGLSLG